METATINQTKRKASKIGKKIVHNL